MQWVKNYTAGIQYLADAKISPILLLLVCLLMHLTMFYIAQLANSYSSAKFLLAFSNDT